MDKQEMIDVMMDFFQTGQEIYGVCPCCNEVFRVSEMQVFYGKEPPKDWLSELRERKKDFTEEKKLLEKDKISFEHDRKKIVDLAIEKSVSIRVGQALEKVAPFIPELNVHPSDVRGIYTPVDFVVFNGMFEKRIDSISFVEVKTGTSKLNPIQKKVCNAVKEGRVDWKEFNATDHIGNKINEENFFECPFKCGFVGITEDVVEHIKKMH